MDMTPKEYQQYVKTLQEKSPLAKDLFFAFLIGGLICVVGQWLQNRYLGSGMEQEAASTATSVTLVGLSALLTGLNLYQKLARFGGAGTLVPITGFANAVVSPAVDFKAEGWVTGVAVKMFSVAGPVIVYGTAASVVYGLIYWVWSILPA
ncbi:MAG: stage V sporulation protein AC [Ruminococcaceae bacterium]|nr:stage V sporulation protein AC [Oscillospiraceae bacterium]